MFARRTIAHPFEHHLADGEALAAQLVQSHTAHGEIAAVLVDAQLNAVLGTQRLQRFGFDQRHLAGAWIGRPLRVKPDPSRVAVTLETDTGDRLDGG